MKLFKISYNYGIYGHIFHEETYILFKPRSFNKWCVFLLFLLIGVNRVCIWHSTMLRSIGQDKYNRIWTSNTMYSYIFHVWITSICFSPTSKAIYIRGNSYYLIKNIVLCISIYLFVLICSNKTFDKEFECDVR